MTSLKTPITTPINPNPRRETRGRKRRLRTRRAVQKHAEYARRRAAGLCVWCRRPARGRAMCPTCAEVQRLRCATAYERRRAENRCTDGCGRVAANGCRCTTCAARRPSLASRSPQARRLESRASTLPQHLRGAGRLRVNFSNAPPPGKCFVDVFPWDSSTFPFDPELLVGGVAGPEHDGHDWRITAASFDAVGDRGVLRLLREPL